MASGIIQEIDKAKPKLQMVSGHGNHRRHVIRLYNRRKFGACECTVPRVVNWGLKRGDVATATLINHRSSRISRQTGSSRKHYFDRDSLPYILLGL